LLKTVVFLLFPCNQASDSHVPRCNINLGNRINGSKTIVRINAPPGGQSSLVISDVSDMSREEGGAHRIRLTGSRRGGYAGGQCGDAEEGNAGGRRAAPEACPFGKDNRQHWAPENLPSSPTVHSAQRASLDRSRASPWANEFSRDGVGNPEPAHLGKVGKSKDGHAEHDQHCRGQLGDGVPWARADARQPAPPPTPSRGRASVPGTRPGTAGILNWDEPDANQQIGRRDKPGMGATSAEAYGVGARIAGGILPWEKPDANQQIGRRHKPGMGATSASLW